MSKGVSVPLLIASFALLAGLVVYNLSNIDREEFTSNEYVSASCYLDEQATFSVVLPSDHYTITQTFGNVLVTQRPNSGQTFSYTPRGGEVCKITLIQLDTLYQEGDNNDQGR